MTYRKFLWLFLLAALLCALLAGCAPGEINDSSPTGATASTLVGTPGDTPVANACYLYTARITEDAFRYLDEIYAEKYPLLGLRWEHGTGADQRIMTAFAQQITAGCSTDAEKVTAIFNWIVTNIRYVEDSSPFSYDVLYNEYGNCLGKAMLMQDMCRVLGIPAVYSDGFRGNMKTFSVEDMHNAEVGHAWLFVHLDGQWVLYDPTWGTSNVTDRTYIAENFYIDTVGGITPIYDEHNMPPFGSLLGSFCYINEKFIPMINGQPAEEFGGSFVNFCMNVNAFNNGDDHIGEVGAFYWDGPAAFAYVGMEEYELYSSGWVGYGESGFLWGDVCYAYENGILASETIMQRGDEIFYFHGGLSQKICLPADAFRLVNGNLIVDAAYTGKIWEPHKNFRPEGEYTYKWFTSDESVATVDQNGVVTCHKPGNVDIFLLMTGVGKHGNEEYKMGEEQNPGSITVEWVDGVPVQTETRGFHVSVCFSNDISRPAKYAALDPGGPAYIEFSEATRMGVRDIYPVMTDDFLMMFEPVDGVITLPTAQNAKGYFIMPDTYEAALTWPYDFRVPLTDGYLLLDRETLKTFTLVDTGIWGEMWYLPLTEEGKNAWGPGTSYEPEQNIDFGYPMIPTDQLPQGSWEPRITEVAPENGVIRTQLLPFIPDLPMPNSTFFEPFELQYIMDQNCALEIIIQNCTLTLDSAAIQTLCNAQKNDFAFFWLTAMELDWCDYGQQERLRRMAIDSIYNLNFEAGITSIHDLHGGTATINVPLNGSGEFEVFLVDAHGNFTKVPSTVNGNTITFEAPYFATYAILNNG